MGTYTKFQYAPNTPVKVTCRNGEVHTGRVVCNASHGISLYSEYVRGFVILYADIASVHAVAIEATVVRACAASTVPAPDAVVLRIPFRFIGWRSWDQNIAHEYEGALRTAFEAVHSAPIKKSGKGNSVVVVAPLAVVRTIVAEFKDWFGGLTQGVDADTRAESLDVLRWVQVQEERIGRIELGVERRTKASTETIAK